MNIHLKSREELIDLRVNGGLIEQLRKAPDVQPTALRAVALEVLLGVGAGPAVECERRPGGQPSRAVIRRRAR